MKTLLITIDTMMVLKPNYVVTGVIQSGEVSIGDTVRIYSPETYIDAKVRGVEVERKIIPTAKRGEYVVLMFKDVNIAGVSDGYIIKESELYPEVVSLTIKETPKQWWQFWI